MAMARLWLQHLQRPQTNDGINVTVNHPPLSGYYINDSFSVEVVIRQPAETFFLKVLGIDQIDYSVRAVANGNVADDINCVYVLDKTHKSAFEVSSDSSLEAHCGIWVNSNDNEKASGVESGACVKASTMTVVGGYKTGQTCDDDGGDAYVCDSPGSCPISGADLPDSSKPIPTPDPFSGLALPAVDRSANACAPEEACDATGCSGKEKDPGGPYESYTVDSSGSTTLSPGTYCGGIHIKKGDVTFKPGVYILRGGGLRIEGGDANASGQDVSFYNTCYFDCNDSSSDHEATKGREWFWPLDINSSATVDFSASPCDGGASGNACEGELDGVLFASDRDAPSSDDPDAFPVNRIDSSVSATLSGAIYVSNQHLKFHSNATGSPPSGEAKSILVSKFLEISSGSSVEINNSSGPYAGSPLKRVTLVE